MGNAHKELLQTHTENVRLREEVRRLTRALGAAHAENERLREVVDAANAASKQYAATPGPVVPAMEILGHALDAMSEEVGGGE